MTYIVDIIYHNLHFTASSLAYFLTRWPLPHFVIHPLINLLACPYYDTDRSRWLTISLNPHRWRWGVLLGFAFPPSTIHRASFHSDFNHGHRSTSHLISTIQRCREFPPFVVVSYLIHSVSWDSEKVLHL